MERQEQHGDRRDQRDDSADAPELVQPAVLNSKVQTLLSDEPVEGEGEVEKRLCGSGAEIVRLNLLVHAGEADYLGFERQGGVLDLFEGLVGGWCEHFVEVHYRPFS